MTLRVSPRTVGVYFCHASVPGFPTVKSRAAHLLLKAPPRITSPTEQTGQLETDVQINCVAMSVPKPINVLWKFHGNYLEESELNVGADFV